MTDMAKILFGIGIVLIIAAGALYLVGKIPGFGKLPGDIMIRKENFTFYFPLTTCIVISLVMSFLFFLWKHRP